MDFFTEEQKRAQEATGRRLAQMWRTNVYWFPKYSPIDFYLADGQDEGVYIRALGEIKSDDRDAYEGAHPTTGKRMFTLFNADRYMALWFARLAFGCPAFVVVQFRNGLRAISVDDITAEWLRMSGPKQVRPGAPQERCPKLLVPIDRTTAVLPGNMEEIAGFHRLTA